jgi:5-methyltetrahydrofolate--homocysteine methyltransferase
MTEAAALGAHAVGGCCGTTDKHIAALVKAASGLPYAPPKKLETDGLAPCYVSGHSQTVTLGARPEIIGERINPTGKPRMKQALRENDMEYLQQEAAAQLAAGAELLDVNVGLPDIDEAAMLKAATEAVQTVVPAPLQLDSASPAALEAALRVYIGKPVINSVSGKQSVMDKVFPLAKKYGAALVALCLDENGIPETADGRIVIAERILAEADKHGVAHSDLLFDALTMAAAADPKAPSVTLETVRRLQDELHVKTVLGVSNVSFGLPNRSLITSAFLSMALHRGLSAAIINPLDAQVLSAFYAARATLGHDAGFAEYIRKYSQATLQAVTQKTADTPAPGMPDKGALQDAIIAGMEAPAGAAAAALIKSGVKPLQVIEAHVIPALTVVGARYESGKIFLPQLMQSAAAAKRAIAEATAHMPPSEPQAEKTIVLATVEGDVHDIGKNIVCTMLQSYGFHTIDLGKNVPPKDVLAALKKSGAKLLGLSALMTTTVPSMRETIAPVRGEYSNSVTIMVGGAVLTETLAEEIGADFYAADAMASVRIAKDVLGASPL